MPRTTNPVYSDAAAIIASLLEQVDCYRHLAKLAELQHEHVQQNQTEGLLDVLRSRAEFLDRIGKLEAVIGPVKRTWSDFLESLRSDARSQAETLMLEAKTLLEEITRRDRDDILVLQQRKLNLGRQINQASTARQINRKYAKSGYGPGSPRMNVQH